MNGQIKITLPRATAEQKRRFLSLLKAPGEMELRFGDRDISSYVVNAILERWDFDEYCRHVVLTYKCESL